MKKQKLRTKIEWKLVNNEPEAKNTEKEVKINKVAESL